MDNIANYLIFPNPNAAREDFVDQLGLEDSEFEWVVKGPPRQVMFKEVGGQSAILNVDLSVLGRYLGAFESGKDSIKRLKRYAGTSDDWVRRYLAA